MKSYPYIPNMVQAITVLTVLKMMTKAQTSCGSGSMNGKVMYERLPNIQLERFDDDIVRDTAPPFMVLEKCQDLCLRDRASNNIVRTCTSFDFQPGSRISNFNGGPEYEESTCYLTREQASPEGIGTLTPVLNSVHFTEVCITSTRPERECPNRRYIFERHPRKKLKLPTADIKEMTASNRSECEDKCLNEFSFVCRSASFDGTMRMCTLSRFTRRTHPELLEDDPNSDYLENTCLNAERRCDGLAVFIKEEGKRLSGPFEVDLFNNITLEDCQGMCVRAEKYFCRSIEYDEMTKQCTISEEDSVSQKGDLVGGTSSTHNFYDFACLDSPRGSEYPDNSVTSHLFTGKKPDTAFQRYRNSRLGGEHHSEISGRSLSECLDECLRQPSFQCRSAVYSERFRTCRLSRYNQKDGMRIIYDADYDYYENLMHNKVGGDGESTNGHRPGESGGRPGERYPPYRPGGRYPPADGDDFGPGYPPAGGHGFPPSSHGYPPSSHGYPPSSNGYPPSSDGYPPSSHGHPPSSHGYPPSSHGDRYPSDRLPPSSHGIDRYPPSSHGDDGYHYGRPIRPEDRFPIRPDDRFPIRPDDRYPIRPDDRFPIRPDDRYPPFPGRPDDRYPDRPGDRLPPPDDRYPIGPPSDRYPGDDRYPSRRPPPIDRYPVYPGDRYPPKYPPGTKYPSPPPSRPSDKLPPTDKYLPPGDKLRPGSNYPPIDHQGEHGNGNRTPPLPGDKYGPSDRYPPGERYPDRYPGGDRHPGSDRYRPGDRYPSRYPYDDRYGDSGRGGDRLIPEYEDRYGGYSHRYGDRFYGSEDRRYGGGRYGSHRYGGDRNGGDRYGGDRYGGDRNGGDRYGGDRNGGDRYGGDRNGGDRYGGDRGGGDRYGGDRYGGDRYGGDRHGGGKYGGDRYGGGKYDNRNGNRYGNKFDYYGDDRDGGSRWFFRPDRRPGGRPIDDRPPYDIGGHRRPLSPGPDGPIYDSYGGAGPGRPYSLRCDEGEDFKQVGTRQRIRKEFVRRFLQTPSLNQCQKECVDNQEFICRSFNYRDGPYGDGDSERENCELSDRDSRDLELTNPEYFENTGNFDFYERSLSRQGIDGDCLDVSQVCNEDGMEFTLRTPEGFYGRIYTYGFYDRCFFRGNGGTVNVLRISGAQGYPECGTQRYGDTMTNIVVVQFSDYVQTGKDKRFNLTCLFRGPGEAVVSSGFIGAGSGSPIPIEYLPAENTLSSKVRLLILYQGRPTTTIAVGDVLTFRLEAQDGYNYVNDIFATNVIARDPYSGRSVQLIDRFGCPVDSYVFPELDKGRNGDSLEARFNAFKIPESNFLVFEATVRTCRDGCQPAYCPSGSGRSEPSFGRRKRDINDTLVLESNNTYVDADESNYTTVSFPESEGTSPNSVNKRPDGDSTKNITNGIEENKEETEPPEFVREMIEVFESREELQQEARKALPVEETVCLTNGEYKGLISTVLVLAAVLITISLLVGLAYKKYWLAMRKNIIADRSSTPISTSYPTTRSSGGISGLTGISIFGTGMQKPFFGRNRNFPGLIKDDLDLQISAPGGPFEDPSEPIYTDPSLFERSRSLRSISVTQKRRQQSSPIPTQMNI